MRIVILVVAVLVLVLAAPVCVAQPARPPSMCPIQLVLLRLLSGAQLRKFGMDLPRQRRLGIAFHPEAGGWQNHRRNLASNGAV